MGSHDPSGIDFQGLYLRYANDEDIRIRETITCSLNESFRLSAPEEDTSKLRQAFHDLLQEKETCLIVAMANNFYKVISLYCNDNAVEGNGSGTPGGMRNGRNNSGDRSPNVGASHLLHSTASSMTDKTSVEPRRKKPVFLHSHTVDPKELESLVQ
jgi:hypothetical protein